MSGDKTDFTIPVSGIYVLDPSGIPLFARYYQGEIDKMDSTLVGGFLSAIEIFVKTNLDGFLSDIGMADSRFFFDRTESGYIIVIIVVTQTENLIEEATLDIVRSLQQTINICFSTLVDSAEANLIPIEVIVENLGTTIDSFLLETSFEYLNPESTDEIYFDTLRSEKLSDETLDKIIETIKSNR